MSQVTTVPVCRRDFAEAFSPLVLVLRQGLLRRPTPSVEGFDLISFMDDYCDTILQAVPDLLDAMQDLDALVNHTHSDVIVTTAEDAAQEVADALVELCLDLLHAARSVWGALLPEELEGLRPLLAALAERPLADVLDRFHAITDLSLRTAACAEKLRHEASPLSMNIAPDMAPLIQAVQDWLTRHPVANTLLGAGSKNRVGELAGLVS